MDKTVSLAKMQFLPCVSFPKLFFSFVSFFVFAERHMVQQSNVMLQVQRSPSSFPTHSPIVSRGKMVQLGEFPLADPELHHNTSI